METKKAIKSPIQLEDKQILGLKRMLSLLDPDALTKEDFMEAFDAVLKVVKDSKSLNEREFAAIQEAFGVFKEKAIKDLSDSHESFKADMRNHLQTLQMQHDTKMSEVDQKLSTVKDGKDVDEDALLDRVLSQIQLPEQKEILLDTPDDIRNKLELFIGRPEEEKLKIEVIGNLREELDSIAKRIVEYGRRVIATSTTLWHLSDVNLAGLATNQSIKWDGTQWIPYTPSGSGGSGYQAPLSGGLTGTNTWTTAPNVLVIDGVPRQKTQTDGTVNWTGTTTTVLTGAPLPTFDIFSSA